MSKKKGPKPLPSAEVCIRQSHGWVAAAVAQGGRLLRLIDAQANAGSPVDWTLEQREAFNDVHGIAWDHLTEEFEAYYFLCALRQVDRWLRHASGVDAELASAFATFESGAPHLKDLRDMREHEDEYLAGGGENADRYKARIGGIEADAHSIVIQGDAYLIGGGRLDVAKTVTALRELLRVVETVRLRVAPPKPVEFHLGVTVM